MLKDMSAIAPVHFFSFELPLKKRKTLQELPVLTDLTGEKAFAKVSIRYDTDGIELNVDVSIPVKDVHYPHVERGDAVEIFIDTRCVKTNKTFTPFCHHFTFLPELIDDIQGVERTKFRGNETRPLADSELLHPTVSYTKSGYEMDIHLPKEVLYGYHLEKKTKIGFAYRIYRAGGSPQHFGMPEAGIEKDPSLWPTLILQG